MPHLLRNFAFITLADFIVRSAYQMGKTPLLPIYAALLGASGPFLGFIVSVSTMTGLITKPFIGILSDRWGRRAWLIAATCVFAGIPFLYRFVSDPAQLALLRVVHGTSTAIFGPVSLAYVAEISRGKVAERVGWFEMARSGGYILGPAVAGALLIALHPAEVFTIIGLLSCLAFAPILLLDEPPRAERKRQTVRLQIVAAFKVALRTPAIWLTGLLESTTFIALYTAKAFLPLFALDQGVSVVMVGLFFSLQEAVHIVLKPVCGRLGDRLGHLVTIAAGMALLVLGLPLLTSFQTEADLLLPAILTGAGQALIFPSTVALVSAQADQAHLGAAMGFAGMMANLGKVIGPVVGGLSIQAFGFDNTFYVLSALLFVSAVIVTLAHWQRLRQLNSGGA